MKIITAFALLALGGCATCERHPLACSIGAAVVVGSVAATIAANGHSDHRDQTPHVIRPVCSGEAC